MSRIEQLRSLVAAILQKRHSQPARSGVVNGLFGVADYITQSFGILIAAPVLLPRLGSSDYGLWVLALSVIATGSLASISLGDATLRYVSLYRGRSDHNSIAETIRTALTANLLMSSALALVIAVGAPYVVRHSLGTEAISPNSAISVLRIGSVILITRSLECVFVSTLRAFERYGRAVRVTAICRAASIAAAIILVLMGYRVIAIMIASALSSLLAVVFLAQSVEGVVGRVSLAPCLRASVCRNIFTFGGFVWIQTLAGVALSHADRLLIAGMLGTSALAAYAICMQTTTAIHGSLAAGFHVLFPHLSSRIANSPSRLRPLVAPIALVNFGTATLVCLPLLLLARPLLSLWMGAQFAQQAWPILSLGILGAFLLSLNITAHYALLALGDVRFVSITNLLAGLLTLAAIVILAPRYGLIGAAIGRLTYGPVTWLLYYRLRQRVRLHETSITVAVTESAIHEAV